MEWTKTCSMVDKLEQLLICPLCNKLMTDPSNMSLCEHYYCRECVLSVLSDNGNCPVCHLPSWVKDIHADYQMTSIVSTFKSLKRLLTEEKKNLARKDVGMSVDESHDQKSPDITTRKRHRQDDCVLKSKADSSLIKRNNRGETPLHVAALKGDIELVDCLLKLGADPNTQDNAKWTPLHEACSLGNITIAKLLVDNGSVINIPGYHNNTPLHDAVENNNIDIVQFLLNNGADYTIRNCYGFTAYELAETKAMRKLLSIPVKTVNIFQPLSVCAIRNNINIVASGLNHEQRVILTNIVTKLGGVVSDTFSKQVCDENMNCTRTMKCLYAVAKGIWLIDYQWILSSNQGGWSNEEKYEVKGFIMCKGTVISDGPRKARQAIMIKKLPGLLEGFEIFLNGIYNSPQPNKENVANLIRLADGKVLSREPKLSTDKCIYPFHAIPDTLFSSHNLIIIHPTISTSIITNNNIIHKPVQWIMNSISSFILINE